MSPSPRDAASAAGIAERGTLGGRAGFDGAFAPADIAPAEQIGSPARGIGIIERALIAYARGPEHPAKVRVLHWLFRRLTFGRLQVRYAGGARIAIDPADYIGWEILRTGSYEPASLALALALMTASPGLFVDVGANVVWFSCAVAALSGSRVIATEPDCGNCSGLRANLGDFPNAIVVNTAAGPDFNLVGLGRRSPGNSGTVAIVFTHPDLGVAPHEWTATAPLDAMLRRVAVPPVRPTLIKIDVEGFERDVLRGLDFDGPFRPRNILMEYTVHAEEGWGGLAGVHAFFGERGYELLDVLGRPLTHPRKITESNVWAQER